MKLLTLLPLLISFSSYFSFGTNQVIHKELVPDSGLTITSKQERYSLKKSIATPIRTYEAWVEAEYIDSVTGAEKLQGDTILGNYSEEYSPGIAFRIYTYKAKIGQPQLCFRYNRDLQKQYTIDENIYGTGKRHVAFTISSTQIKGYLDGVLKNTWAFNNSFPELDVPYSVGGDDRSINSWWFDGTIYSINAFSTIRSASQITSDMNNGVSIQDNLLIGFDFKNTGFTNIADATNHLESYLYDDEFIDSSNYDYTFAFVPDTQAVMYYYRDNFSNVYDFVVDKKDEMNISMVVGLGDITEKNTDEEWLVARNNIYKLADNNVPFNLVRGNHDVIANWVGEDWRLKKFNQFFNNNTYRSQLSGCFNNDIANSYRTIEVCGNKYLFLALDYGPCDEVLSWADDVVDSFSDYNVIISTHAFLFRDGTFLDANDVYPPAELNGYNNGDDIWDKFVKKHANISMVVCGHDPTTNIVKSTFTGDHGNKVTCLLIDPQYVESKIYGLGCVALFHFSNNGEDISIEYYSTIQQKFFRTCNQLSFSIDTVNSLSNIPNYVGGEFKSINDASNLSQIIEVVIADVDIKKAVKIVDNNLVLSTLSTSKVIGSNCEVFDFAYESNQCSFKNKQDKYLSINGEELVLDDVEFKFDIVIDSSGVLIKHNEKYLSFSSTELVLCDETSYVNLLYFELLFSDYVTETERYINRFMDSYLCGFDDYSPASIYVWEALHDDYDRMSDEARNELITRIENDDGSIQQLVERYARVIYLHSEFENFLNLNNSIIARYFLDNKVTGSIIYVSVITAISITSFVIIILVIKKRKNNL